MGEVKLNALVLNQNILKYVQTSAVAAKAVYNRPEKFDPNRPTVDSWVQVSLTKCEQSISRLEPGLCFDGVVKCECYARTQTALLAHIKLCSEVQDALCQKHFNILDYQESGDPVIGYCSLYEPSIVDKGQLGVYQLAVLTVKFKAEQTA